MAGTSIVGAGAESIPSEQLSALGLHRLLSSSVLDEFEARARKLNLYSLHLLTKSEYTAVYEAKLRHKVTARGGHKHRKHKRGVIVKVFPAPHGDRNVLYDAHIKALRPSKSRFLPKVIVEGKTGSVRYIVIERIVGRSLADILAGGGLSLERSTAIALSLATAVSDTQAHDAYDLDLKPSNVVIRRQDDTPVLVDFGARLCGDEEPRRLYFLTENYTAPELAAGRVEPSGATEAYSLGMIYLEMLCGTEEAKRMQEDLAATAEGQLYLMGYSSESALKPFQDVAIRALLPDARDRTQSAAEFREELAKVREGLGTIPYKAAERGSPPGSDVRRIDRESRMTQQGPRQLIRIRRNPGDGDTLVDRFWRYACSAAEKLVPASALILAPVVACFPGSASKRITAAAMFLAFALATEAVRGVLAKRLTGHWFGSILNARLDAPNSNSC